MTEKAMTDEVIHSKTLVKTSPSITCTLKLPNFFTRPEYHGITFVIKSTPFEFDDATWQFKFYPDQEAQDCKSFIVLLVRLNSEIPQQKLIYQITLLDGNDEHYSDFSHAYLFDKNNAAKAIVSFNNKNSSYDTRDNLTLVIEMFRGELTKEDATKEPFTTDRGIVSLSQDFKDVLLNGHDHNLTFNVRDKEFRAHQDILRARSEVFRSMLSHDMLEKNSGVINVPDCDPQAFEQLLRYIYTGKVETLDASNMFDLYYAADKYNLAHLKEQCCKFIKKSLTVTNICNALELASKHIDEPLLDKAISYFFSNVDDILPTVEWQLFMKENSTVANELFIKSLKKEIITYMAENMEGKMFLFKMPRKTTSPVSYRLKVPNFFTLPEYDGTSFEINSPCFEFASATWCFRCKPKKKKDTGTDLIKNFDIYLVRLHFKMRVQTIFSCLILQDADDKEYDYDFYGHVFKKNEVEENCIANLSNEVPSYDTRDTLNLIIDLYISTEMDVQINKKASNNDEQDATGTQEHIEMYPGLLSVTTTDRGIISLKQQFKDMLLNGQDYNVIFNVGNLQFRAHQDILRVRSKVFRSILNHEMLEKNSDVINVPDCDPGVFQQILTYIYTGQVDSIDTNNMFDLYYAAEKYRLVDLKDESRKFIMKSLTVTNVCKALELAMKHFDASSLDYVSNYFINNIDDILPTVEWQLFMKEHTTASNELFIKSRKQGVPQSTTEKSKDCEISLTELSSGVVSSTSYTLKVPNFFTLPEYNGVSFKLISPFFKFANATWQFRCNSGGKKANMAGGWIKSFVVRMVRLSSKLPEQKIFYQIAILDAGDEEYMSQVGRFIFDEDEEELVMKCISNKIPTYDRRDNLTLIIHLFYIEPVEADADRITLATVRGFKLLSQDFKNVLLNGQDHNLILNVRDMKFQAHRDILRARSEVFRSMLSHNMQEKNSGVIDVQDCDPEAFKQLLYYIYTENVEKLDEDNMFSLYYAADKYNLTYLKEACSEVIRRSLSVNNVCNALELANKHCDDDILCSATSYFLSNMDDILLTDSWILFMKEHTYVANELIIKSRAMLKNVKS